MYKVVFVLIGLLVGSAAYAATPYTYEGVVNAQSIDTGEVTIDYQQYQIDNKTIVHGLMRQGEQGPLFTVGQSVGFNTEPESGGAPRITELWPLSNPQ